MKKIFLVTLMLLAVFTLAACGDRGAEQTGRIVEWYELSEDASLDTEQDITITFWHTMGADNQALLQSWIEDFEALYPNIDVIEEKKADDYTQLSDKVALAITAGNAPNIVQSYPDHIARYATAKAPLALNNFINHPTLGFTEEEVADFLPGLWNEGKSYDNEGTFLSLPFQKSSEALFYNATYFDEKGYEVPTTWDEVFEIAELIKADEPDAYPFGYDSEDNLFITASEQWGAPYTGFNEETGRGEVQFNNEDSKDMVEYFKDKVDRGLMLTRSLNGGAYTSDLMKTGEKTYMYVGSTGGTRYAYYGMTQAVFDDGYRVGVAPLPAFEDNQKQIQQGPNINLFKKDDEQQLIASWLFAKFLVAPEQTAELGTTSGYAPVRYSAYETDTWNDYVADISENPTTINTAIQKLIKESIEMFLNNGDIFFTSSVFNLSSKTRTEVGALITKIFTYEPVGATEAEKEADLRRYIDEQYQESYDFITG
jgi:multiple sugar transport system substrate-binding protein